MIPFISVTLHRQTNSYTYSYCVTHVTLTNDLSIRLLTRKTICKIINIFCLFAFALSDKWIYYRMISILMEGCVVSLTFGFNIPNFQFSTFKSILQLSYQFTPATLRSHDHSSLDLLQRLFRPLCVHSSTAFVPCCHPFVPCVHLIVILKSKELGEIVPLSTGLWTLVLHKGLMKRP